jgi:maleate isomerase
MGNDSRGWRLKLGVIGPSTNTVVQPDFDDFRLPGITNHYSRIYTPNAQAVSNESFLAGTKVVANNVSESVTSVMTCNPDYLVMGMSAITFYGGVSGADRFEQEIKDSSGVGVSLGSHSVRAALQAYGKIKRIAFMSPYFPAANQLVSEYFEECGYEVVRSECLQAKSWTAIAEISEDQVRSSLKRIDGEDVDAVIQIGTNLSAVRVCAEAEQWLGKPVIAINTATYWHALRANGVPDKIHGFGRLLSEM